MVYYVVTARNSKAARKRLDKALLCCSGVLKDSFCLDPDYNAATVVWLVQLDPAMKDHFTESALPQSIEYASPKELTASGNMQNKFTSAEEEERYAAG